MIQGSLFDEGSTQPASGTRMPALTLWQPWCSLVLVGAKVHETRSWPIPERLYGRRLALHAGSGRPPASMISEELDALCVRHWGPDWREGLPMGMVLATCTASGHARTEVLSGSAGADDLASGIWTPGRWAWRLDDVLELPRPVRASGAQGIWTWTVPTPLHPAAGS